MKLKLFIFLLLLTISSDVFAYTKHYDSSAAAQAACNAREASAESQQDNPQKNCYLQAGDSSAGVWYYGQDLHAWLLSGCSAGTYSGNNGQCKPIPSDEECAAGDATKRSKKTYNSADEMTDEESVQDFQGCLYAMSGQSQCYFTGVAVGQISCEFDFDNLGLSRGNTGSTSATETLENPPINPDISDGGETTISESTTPITTTTDSPSQGDITESQTKTETITKNDEITIKNNDSTTEVTKTQFGNVTKTETTTTVTNADGTQTTTTTTSFDQTGSSKETTTFDRTNSTSSTTTSNESGKSGTTTTVTINNIDGSTTTNITNTGSGGNGNSDSSSNEENQSNEFGDFNSTGSADALYTRDDQLTVNSVLNDFKDDVFNTQLVGSITTFFDINIGGQCPVWTIPAVWIFPSIPIDMQCSQVMNDIWPYISAVILLSASFLAFRWAVL